VTADSTSADSVISRYSALARAARDGDTITDCDPAEFAAGNFGAAAYPGADSVPEAALRASLGCGNPVVVADLRPGETVLDLGSGGGLDVLLSARRVAPDGTAYGLDASPDMLSLARASAADASVTNAVFLNGRIEDIPLPGEHVDVVISNCVINLSADKPRVLAEAFRVLKPGGRLGIADITADDADPSQLAQAGQQVGCTCCPVTEAHYRGLLEETGFTAINIARTRDHGSGLHSAIIQAAKPVTGQSRSGPAPCMTSRSGVAADRSPESPAY
jgi:arsenite methyltransferase